jgi:transposase, IS5 family
MKTEGHLGRCYLKGRAGDAANVILSAVGHNFRRILVAQRTLVPVPGPTMAKTFGVTPSLKAAAEKALPMTIDPSRHLSRSC